MNQEQARAFRQELQVAREKALEDAEAFQGIIQVIERLGQFRFRRLGDLGKYEETLTELAWHSPLAFDVADDLRTVHQPFKQLYSLVRDARNDALHIGARARTLTDNTIQLALILEDALRFMGNYKLVGDFMIRNPVCAQLWQPVSFARQIMLTHSFSYLPIKIEDRAWGLLSDLVLAKYLQGAPSDRERKLRLAKPIDELLLEPRVEKLPAAARLRDDDQIKDILSGLKQLPCLVFNERDSEEPVGILTPFDLL